MQHWFRMVHGCITTHAHQEELDYNQHQTLWEISLYLRSLFIPHLIRFSWKTKTQPSLLTAAQDKQTELDTILFPSTVTHAYLKRTHFASDHLCHKVSDCEFKSRFWELNVSRQDKRDGEEAHIHWRMLIIPAVFRHEHVLPKPEPTLTKKAYSKILCIILSPNPFVSGSWDLIKLLLFN